ncbi:LOW QUALITY PROTEIN: hypothetical protein KIPB_001394 [Kipferlia bialata]|uniref:Uncharacterized protein n=1 Tax=Kipferlia bialata TaxID=797122 RepID=A0A9K3CRY4_9EUKA|nr:LOW QUALITY PROTEIN: hypothetical protein KIPB_001394 [Kipferlia bialata]
MPGCTPEFQCPCGTLFTEWVHYAEHAAECTETHTGCVEEVLLPVYHTLPLSDITASTIGRTHTTQRLPKAHPFHSAVWECLEEGGLDPVIYGSWGTVYASPQSDMDIAVRGGSFMDVKVQLACAGAYHALTDLARSAMPDSAYRRGLPSVGVAWQLCKAYAPRIVQKLPKEVKETKPLLSAFLWLGCVLEMGGHSDRPTLTEICLSADTAFETVAGHCDRALVCAATDAQVEGKPPLHPGLDPASADTLRAYVATLRAEVTRYATLHSVLRTQLQTAMRAFTLKTDKGVDPAKCVPLCQGQGGGLGQVCHYAAIIAAVMLGYFGWWALSGGLTSCNICLTSTPALVSVRSKGLTTYESTTQTEEGREKTTYTYRCDVCMSNTDGWYYGASMLSGSSSGNYEKHTNYCSQFSVGTTAKVWVVEDRAQSTCDQSEVSAATESQRRSMCIWGWYKVLLGVQMFFLIPAAPIIYWKVILPLRQPDCEEPEEDTTGGADAVPASPSIDCAPPSACNIEGETEAYVIDGGNSDLPNQVPVEYRPELMYPSVLQDMQDMPENGDQSGNVSYSHII